MTTGVPIYLVSACTSGEEFVAAFRRYADKTGLFIPMAEPLAAGRKARFALTLRDGGVMVEGEAEVITSARSPSVLHGRVGMTVRFVEPDDASRTVLTELEKARLAMKPAPPSIPPRPADVPAAPRPVPPTPAGRIDAVNALAECVAIGDPTPTALAPPVSAPPKSGQKFVMPTFGGAPTKPLTGAMPPLARSGSATEPPKTPVSIPPPPVRATAPMPPIAKEAAPRQETSQLPLVGRAPAPSSPVPVPIAPVAAPPSGYSATMAAVVPDDLEAPPPREKIISASMTAVPRPASGSASAPTAVSPPLELEPEPEPVATIAAKTATRDDPTTPSMAPPPSAAPPRMPGYGAPPPMPSAPPPTPTGAAPAPPRPPSASPPSQSQSQFASTASASPDASATFRGAPPSKTEPPPPRPTTLGAPILPRQPASGTTPPRATPAVPLPVTRLPASPAPPPPPDEDADDASPFTARTSTKPGIEPAAAAPLVPAPPIVAAPQPLLPDVEIAEPTDLTEIPLEPEPPPMRAAREPRKTVLGVAVVPSGDFVLPASLAPAPPVVAERPQQPPPVVEEPTPSGDWTMTPGAAGPTIAPRVPKPAAPPTGDWLIALDPTAPDGWTEPAKVEKVEVNLPPPPGPPVSTVSSEVALDSAPKPEPTIASDGPKVQIDPTLVEPVFEGQADSYEPPQFIANLTGNAMTTLPGLAPMPLPLATTPMAAPSLDAMMPPEAPFSPTAPAMTAQMGSAGTGGQMITLQMGPVTPAQTIPPTPLPMQMLTPPPRAQTPMPLPSATGPNMAYPSDPPPMPMAYAPMRAPTDGGAAEPRYSDYTATAAMEPRKSKRFAILLVVGGLAVVAVVIAVIVAMRGKSSPQPTQPPIAGSGATPSGAVQPPAQPPPAPAPVGSDGSAQQAAVPPVGSDAPSAQPPPTPPPAPVECFADVATAPSGAEIVANDAVVGTSPARVKLPCGEKVELTLRKAHFISTSRTVTATPEGAKVRAALAKPTFSVKVTSTPPGATIMLNGKSLGVTPATVKLPAFEASTVTLQKDGFLSDAQKVTPKANNVSIHSTLKRRGR